MLSVPLVRKATSTRSNRTPFDPGRQNCWEKSSLWVKTQNLKNEQQGFVCSKLILARWPLVAKWQKYEFENCVKYHSLTLTFSTSPQWTNTVTGDETGLASQLILPPLLPTRPTKGWPQHRELRAFLFLVYSFPLDFIKRRADFRDLSFFIF